MARSATVLTSIIILIISNYYKLCLCSMSNSRYMTFEHNLYSFPSSIKSQNYQWNFTRTHASECLYESSEMNLICSGPYNYHSITEIWQNQPEIMRYVQVNCKRERFNRIYDSVCFCTNHTVGAFSDYAHCQLERLSRAMFQHLDNVAVINLAHNEIVHIAPDTFHDVTNVEFISLADNHIVHLQPGMFCGLTKLRFLDLRMTGQELFVSSAFQCGNILMLQSNDLNQNLVSASNYTTNLEYLDLSLAHIYDIPPHAFSSLVNLIWLNLSYGQIEIIKETAFSGAISLKFLSLTGNKLHILPQDICSSLPNLEILELDMNAWHYFNTALFSACGSLKLLNFSQNSVREINGDVSAIAALESLDLSQNELKLFASNSTKDPLAVSSSLKYIDLSHNMIEHFSISASHYGSSLDILILKSNLLSESTLSLSGLVSLRHLDLSDNQITSLSVVFLGSLVQLDVPTSPFEDLLQLEWLDLSGNSLISLSDGDFQGLKNLKHLFINNNNLAVVAAGTFAHLSSLEALELSGNKMVSFPVNTLPPGLRRLILNNNSLKTIPVDIVNGTVKNLTELNLGRNKISQINEEDLTHLVNLKRLDLGVNTFSYKLNLFKSATSLEDLNLEWNNLSIAFHQDPFWGSANLKRLNLAYNTISSISSLFEFDTLAQLEEVNLTGNPIVNIDEMRIEHATNHLKKLILDRCKISYIAPEAFYKLPNLENVSLRINEFKKFIPFHVSQDVRFDMRDNPIICSCDMRWLKEAVVQMYGKSIHVPHYDVGTCWDVLRTRQIPVSNVPIQDFMCDNDVSKLCHSSCTCYAEHKLDNPVVVICRNGLNMPPEIVSSSAKKVYMDGNDFSGLNIINSLGFGNDINNVEEIYLNRSKIIRLSGWVFKHTPLLKIIHLDNNFIGRVMHDLFGSLKQLRELYINDNKLTFIEPTSFEQLDNLKILDLRRNNLKTLPSDVMRSLAQLPRLERIYISNNPWLCSFKYSFVQLIDSKKPGAIADLDQVTCNVDQNDSKQVRPSPSWCPDCVPKFTSHAKQIIIGICVVAVILVFVFIFVHQKRRDIYAICLERFNKTLFRPKWDTEVYYDAYVVHDTRDEDACIWVRNVLIPRMEHRATPYRVFFPERDINPGETIADTTFFNIEESRRTLVVVTDTFAQNQWCSRAFQHAYQFMLRDRHHRVVPIFIDKLDLEDLDTPLKVLVMMGEHLNARGRFFWQRLKYILPNPTPTSIPIPEHDMGMSENDVIIDNTMAISETTPLEGSSHV